MRNRKWRLSTPFAVVAFALLAGLTLAKTSAAQEGGDNYDRNAHTSATSKHKSPFACDRLALDPAARKRHFDELGPALRSMRKAVRELPDGYEFQFPADPKTIAMVAEWAAGERLCCPFFDIQLRMEPESGPFWLRITGRNGTKDFIKVDGASWIKAVS